MYVCVCKGVTDKQIKLEMQNGAASLDDLQERLEVGLCCGQCKEYAQEIMEQCAFSDLAYAV